MLVAAGDGERLIRVSQPLAYVTTAAGYVEKYGPVDPYDLLRYLPFVRCPSLVVIGEQSLKTSAAVAGLPESLAELVSQGCRVQTRVLPGADISYANDPQRPFAETWAWLRDVSDPGCGGDSRGSTVVLR